MARARNIKPGFFTNEVLGGACSFGAQLLFSGLWMVADRLGRLQDRPLKIKGEIFPHRNVDVDQLLNELATSIDSDGSPFIIRYQVEGKRYIQVVNFVNHQRPHKNEAASRIPPVPANKAAKHDSGNGAPRQSTMDMPQPVWRPDPLLTDTGILNADSGSLKAGSPQAAGLNGNISYGKESARLADLWCFHLKRRRHGAPADSPYDKAHEIEEMLRLGHTGESIEAEILRNDRDRAEQFFRLRDRLHDARAGPSMRFDGLKSFAKKQQAREAQ